MEVLIVLQAFAVASGEYKTAHNPSYVDYLLGAMSFHKDTVIATIDHKDFPLFLYDRLYLKIFDLNNDIFTVGFYKINENKYSSLVDLASKIPRLVATLKLYIKNPRIQSHTYFL